MLRSWVLGISAAVTLAGCASHGTTTGAGRAAVSPSDVNADTTRAIQEFESRRRTESWPDQALRPDLDHDVTQGVQSRGLNRAIGR